MNKAELNAIRLAFQKRDRETNILQKAQWKEMDEMRQQVESSTRQYIHEHNLLQLCTWNLVVRDNRIYLCAEEYSQDVLKLSELTETDHHCQFALIVEKNKNGYELGKVTLHYSDGEISIAFDSNDLVADFIKDWKLTVHTKGIDEHIERMQSSVDALQHLKAQVQ